MINVRRRIMVTIKLADLKLLSWLAQQTIKHLKTKADKKLAKGSLQRFKNLIKTVDSKVK